MERALAPAAAAATWSMSTKASWDIVRVVPLRSRVAQSMIRRVSTQAPHRALTTAGRRATS